MNKKLSALSKPVTVDPVTVETVRERLSFLDDLNARGVGTAVRSQQFEIACLRELLAAEQHIAELEAKLAMPVRLPERYYVDCGVGPDPNGDWLNCSEVVDTLREHSFTVDGDE